MNLLDDLRMDQIKPPSHINRTMSHSKQLGSQWGKIWDLESKNKALEQVIGAVVVGVVILAGVTIYNFFKRK